MLRMSWHMLLQLLKAMVMFLMTGSSLCLDQQLCRLRKLQSLHHLCPKCNYWVSLFICKWLYCTKTGTSSMTMFTTVSKYLAGDISMWCTSERAWLWYSTCEDTLCECPDHYSKLGALANAISSLFLDKYSVHYQAVVPESYRNVLFLQIYTEIHNIGLF